MKPVSHLATAAALLCLPLITTLHAQSDASGGASAEAGKKPRVVSSTSEPIRVSQDSEPVERLEAFGPEDFGFFVAQASGIAASGYSEEEQAALIEGFKAGLDGAQLSPRAQGILLAQQGGLEQFGFTAAENASFLEGLKAGIDAGPAGQERARNMQDNVQRFAQQRMQQAQQQQQADATASYADRAARVAEEKANAGQAISMETQEEIRNEWADKGPIQVALETNKGTIQLELMPETAPMAVANFVKHIHNDYYDGVIFHRVIPGFMIQGGDPDGTGRGGESVWGKPFPDEVSEDVTFSEKYLLAMANAGPATNGSQFFITVAQTPHLNMRHTIFGKVTDGQGVVDAIAAVETNESDKPTEDVVIKEAKVLSGS
jgi:peptidylprolyl isomerase